MDELVHYRTGVLEPVPCGHVPTGSNNETADAARVTCPECQKRMAMGVCRALNPSNKCPDCNGTGYPGGRAFNGFGGARCDTCGGSGRVTR